MGQRSSVGIVIGIFVSFAECCTFSKYSPVPRSSKHTVIGIKGFLSEGAKRF